MDKGVKLRGVGRRPDARSERAARRQGMAAENGDPGSRLHMKKRKRIELVNAQIEGRGSDRLTVQGLAEAKIAAFRHALAHNLRRRSPVMTF
jgi:IS5 family transposase